VPLASTLLTIASPHKREGFMRKVTEWIHGTLASGREAEERLPGSIAPSISFHKTFSVCPNHRLLVVTEGRERAIGREYRPMHGPGDKPAAVTLFVGSSTEPGPRASTSVPEQGSARLSFAEDGVFIVDADSGRVLQALPLTRQRGAERINSDVTHNTGFPRQMEILHNTVCDITPHVRLLRRARRRMKALAAANRPQGSQARIEPQVRRIMRLVDDLVEVSWINHGRLRLQRERVDLRLVVNNAIETLQPDIKERNQHLCVALPDSPVWLQADSWRLE
jgi:hypothetical protein